jgi:MFS transporter, DHA2 family, multidrug resistance protein
VASAAEGKGGSRRKPKPKQADPDAGWSNERSAAGKHNPWLIVLVISLATFMEVLDTSIANVSLNHIAGSLAVSNDEATWVLTSYLVANAVVVPISGWLGDVMGRKRFYMMSVLLFTVASLFCGIAPSLGILVVSRVIQGIGGGGLASSEQSFLADTFPPSQRGMAFAAYGVVVVVAPVIGPAIGGWITDNISWHWIFLINVPVGIVSLILVHFLVVEPEVLERERAKRLKKGLRVDAFGFALVALGLGCLEVFMDRGQRDDWFGSTFICAMALIAVLSLVMLVVWELNRKDPIVDLRLFGHLNFAVCFFMMLLVGVIIYGSTQIVPQMLQEVFGYTATDAGLTLTVGGIVSLFAMGLAGALSGVIEGRWLLAFAFLLQGLGMWVYSHFDTDAAFHQFALARLIQAAGIPFLFVPILTQSYAGLKPQQFNHASALMNVARNLGGSMGISAAQAMLEQREQFHQARLVEGLNPLNPNYVQGIQQIGATVGDASTAGDPSQTQLAVLYQNMTQQAAMLSYLDVFHALMLFMFCAVVMAFMLKPMKGGH